MTQFRNKIFWILVIIVLAFSSSIFFSFLKLWLGINPGATDCLNQRLTAIPLWSIIPLLLSPIAEEWIFRKKIPDVLEKKINRSEAILFANGLFAILHMDWFFFSYFINGCIYALGYEKTKDLKVPILIHMAHNAIVFFLTMQS